LGSSLRVISRLIREKKYSIVHIVHVGKHTADIANMVKENHPVVKLIYSCHSLLKYENKIRLPRPQEIAYEEMIINSADHIHLLNKSSMEYFLQCFPEKKHSSISIIGNGIKAEDFQEIDQELIKSLREIYNSNKNSIVFCMTRWSFGKGLEVLIEAIPKVLTVNRDVKFIIAGRKKKSWENKAGKYVGMVDKKIKDLKEHVFPYGWLNDLERNTFYKFSDLVIMPSYLEYFPFSLLEPIACKVPVVSSNIPCAAELLTHEKDCLLFESGKADELALQILRMINDKGLQKSATERAFKKITNGFEVSAIARKYHEMYLSMATSPSYTHSLFIA
jgi:glycosyltransferase involved in cell wall biosynthesis